MNKKILAAITAGFLTLALAQPASAATSGGSCTSKGATLKIGKNNYVCDKNPFFNKTKLTWVWDGCLEMANEYATEFKTTSDIIKTAESDRLKLMAPVVSSINDLLKWSPLISYSKGSVVFGNNNYYSAVKSNVNKGLTTSNIGTSKFWKVYRPTTAKASLGQAPMPQTALDTAERYISSLTLNSSVTKDAALRTKYENLISQLNSAKNAVFANKADIDQTIFQVDDSIDTVKATLNLLEIWRPTLVSKCKP